MSDISRFSRPIPGQGLTDPLGAHPWQKPPMYVHLDDALEFVWDRMTQPPNVGQVLALLQHGELSAQDIADVVLMQGFTQGMWTVTLGMLMVKPVIQMVVAIAHKANIKYKIKTKKPDPLVQMMTSLQLASQTGLNITPDDPSQQGQPQQPSDSGTPSPQQPPAPAGGLAGMAPGATAPTPPAPPQPGGGQPGWPNPLPQAGQ